MLTPEDIEERRLNALWASNGRTDDFDSLTDAEYSIVIFRHRPKDWKPKEKTPCIAK